MVDNVLGWIKGCNLKAQPSSGHKRVSKWKMEVLGPALRPHTLQSHPSSFSLLLASSSSSGEKSQRGPAVLAQINPI